MQRVYTDERFPGYSVVNDGSCVLEVQHKGRTITTFESWEKKGGTLSEAFAARRAQDFFERNAQVTDHEIQEALDGLPKDRDCSDIVNAPPSAGHNAAVIDRMLEREKQETDPDKKRRLRLNIMQLMKQEETLAEAVVSHLIEN